MDDVRQLCLRRELMMRLPWIDPWLCIHKGSGVDAKFRSVVVNWLMDVVDDYDCERQVLFLACNYMDRFLCRREISRSKVQLLGGAALLVASKLHEHCHVSTKHMACVTLKTVDDVVRMEQLLIQELSFDLSVPTPLTFLELTSESDNVKARWICELALLDDRAQRAFLPSQIARAAVRLSKIQKYNNNNNNNSSQAEQYLTILIHNLFKIRPKWAKNILDSASSHFLISQ